MASITLQLTLLATLWVVANARGGAIGVAGNRSNKGKGRCACAPTTRFKVKPGLVEVTALASEGGVLTVSLLGSVLQSRQCVRLAGAGRDAGRGEGRVDIVLFEKVRRRGEEVDNVLAGIVVGVALWRDRRDTSAVLVPFV